MPVSLAIAQDESLDRLLRIVRESPSDREARLAAAVILRMKPAEPEAAAPAQPAEPAPVPAKPQTSPAVSQPAQLTLDELSELCLRLPHVDPARFVTKHTPDYWRAIIADWHPPAAQTAGATGPPRARPAAA